MSESTDNRKAKEILSSLSQREPVGDRILQRVGQRLWGRFNAATSSRLFQIYDIPDPYQPEGFDSKWAIKLGPVSLRLGENRRQPAPHLTVREPKTSKDNPNVGAQFRPKGIPEAKRPPPPPPPKPKPEIKPAPQAQAQTPEHPPIPKGNAYVPKRNKSDLAAEFGVRPSPESQAPASLPVRPDLIQTLVDKGVKLPPHLQAQYEAMQAQQPAQSTAKADSTPAQAPPQRSVPRPAPPRGRRTTQSGRMRMRPQRHSTPQVISEADQSSFEPFPVGNPTPATLPSSEGSSAAKPEAASSPAPPPAPPQTTPPSQSTPPINRSPSAGGGSLDDLFGFTGQGRMRVGKPTRRKPGLSKSSEPSDKDG